MMLLTPLSYRPQLPSRKRVVVAVIGSRPMVVSQGSDQVIEFGSVPDILRYAFESTDCACKTNKPELLSVLDLKPHSRWYDGMTPTLAKKYAEDPPKRITDAVDAMRRELEEQVEPPQRSRRRRRSRLDDGVEIDPEAVCRREIDGWSDMTRAFKQHGVFSLALNASCSAIREPHALLYRGAAACAVSDIAEAQGLSTELEVFANFSGAFYSSAPHRNAVVRVRAKNAGTPWSIGSVATAASHIGFLRLVICAAMLRAAEHPVVIGLGIPGRAPDWLKMQSDSVIEANVVTKDGAIQAAKRAARLGERGQ